MLVVDLHALHPVHFLHLVDDVLLHLGRALDRQNIPRRNRAVRQRHPGADVIVLLHQDLARQRNEITFHIAHFRSNDDLAVTALDLAERNLAVDFRNHGRIRRVPRLEQFGHTRQTAGDIARLADGSRNLNQNLSGFDGGVLLHDDMRAYR